VIKRHERMFFCIVLASDAAALALAFVASHFLYPAWPIAPEPDFGTFAGDKWLPGVIVPAWLAALAWFGLYRPSTYRLNREVLRALAKAHAVASVGLGAAMYFAISGGASRAFLLTFVVTSLATLGAEKLTIRAVIAWLARRTREGGGQRVLVIGKPDDARRYLEIMRNHARGGIELAGVLPLAGYSAVSQVGEPEGGEVHESRTPCSSFGFDDGIDEVVAAAPLESAPLFAPIAEACAERGLAFRLLMTLPAAAAGKYYVDDLGDGSCLISLETVPVRGVAALAKRAVDIIAALAGLAICALIYPAYARRLRRESPGPVLFRQTRRGRNGRPFTIYKFRTMHPDAEERLAELMSRNQMNGSMFKLKDDPRVTPTGRWMRRTHLDELPQFWNVLRGEMSLVGARPPTCAEVARYRPAQRRRLSIKPGITGLWQISGNGAVRDFDEVVRLDCAYIDQWSLWLDCKIVARTIAKMLRAEGW
jgi:exopolysaccharide biosynthesis polyprenyl glycosylphosphotransferase